MIRGAVIGALLGAFTGTIGLAIACGVCLLIAFQSHGSAALPGVFEAWFATVGRVPQLRFRPDGDGMLTALAVWTAVAAVLGAMSGRRGARRERTDARG